MHKVSTFIKWKYKTNLRTIALRNDITIIIFIANIKCQKFKIQNRKLELYTKNSTLKRTGRHNNIECHERSRKRAHYKI